MGNGRSSKKEVARRRRSTLICDAKVSIRIKLILSHVTIRRKVSLARRFVRGFRVSLAWAILFAVAQPALALERISERIATDPLSGIAIFGYDPVGYFLQGKPVSGLSSNMSGPMRRSSGGSLQRRTVMLSVAHLKCSFQPMAAIRRKEFSAEPRPRRTRRSSPSSTTGFISSARKRERETLRRGERRRRSRRVSGRECAKLRP